MTSDTNIAEDSIQEPNIAEDSIQELPAHEEEINSLTRQVIRQGQMVAASSPKPSQNTRLKTGKLQALTYKF